VLEINISSQFLFNITYLILDVVAGGKQSDEPRQETRAVHEGDPALHHGGQDPDVRAEPPAGPRLLLPPRGRQDGPGSVAIANLPIVRPHKSKGDQIKSGERPDKSAAEFWPIFFNKKGRKGDEFKKI
jgi:hypothetical protein